MAAAGSVNIRSETRGIARLDFFIAVRLPAMSLSNERRCRFGVEFPIGVLAGVADICRGRRVVQANEVAPSINADADT